MDERHQTPQSAMAEGVFNQLPPDKLGCLGGVASQGNLATQLTLRPRPQPIVLRARKARGQSRFNKSRRLDDKMLGSDVDDFLPLPK
ncbi:MAG: hypothetical protein ACYC6Y_15765 [Thermoguttaceae bacterium]